MGAAPSKARHSPTLISPLRKQRGVRTADGETAAARHGEERGDRECNLVAGRSLVFLALVHCIVLELNPERNRDL